MEIPEKPNKNASKQAKKEWQKYLDNETKAQRTKRVIEPRINKVLSDIAKLKKTANSPRYEFNEEMIEKIESALTKQVNEYVEELKGSSPQVKTGIEL